MFKLIDNVIKARDPQLPYDDVGPGLYPDETVVRLDTKELIAVSVSRKRRPNGDGMEFRAWARVIEKDGATKLDHAGVELENEFSYPVSMEALWAVGDDAIAKLSKELMLLVLGEPPTMVDVLVDLTTPEFVLPEGHFVDRTAASLPLIPVSEEVRKNVSIREAISLSAVIVEGDAASLLKD